MANSPFFMTHHAPVGAWSSLTFGLPGRGVSIDHEDLQLTETADFLIAFSRGQGQTVAFPFVSGIQPQDYEGHTSRQANSAANSYKERWSFIDPANIRRTLTPCVDEYATDNVTLRVYTPHSSIPNPKRTGYPQFAVVPGILLEVVVDNSQSDQPATAFVGVGYRGKGRIRPMDWSTNNALCGVGLASEWALAATNVPNTVFTIRDNRIAQHVENATQVIHNGGNEGGITIRVAAGQTKTVYLAFAFYHGGPVTQGIEGTYYYTNFFLDLESVANFILRNAMRIKESCVNFDKKIATTFNDQQRTDLFAQSLRAYYANSQLIMSNGIPYFSVCEGQFCWRNTLDLAVDHAAWELFRNPWIVRNVFDLYSAHYSYRDELTFPGDEDPSALHPGGLSFCHDVGSYTAYSPDGTSGYEMPNLTGVYSYMTSEQLLNGLYLLTSYALMSDDEPWSRTRLATARELLDSLEARDHHDVAKRDGILKAESSICGPKGSEITTYDALDESLKSARGNLYIAIKTWCANLMLTAYFQQHNDPESAQRAYNMAHATAKTILASFKEDEKCFPANLFTPSASRTIAPFEAMALPLYCNLKHYFQEFPDLLAKLKEHALSCLQSGQCIDAATGGLRLSSTSESSWPSKVGLVIYTLENLFDIKLADYPSIQKEWLHWTQVSAAQETIADQINVVTRQAQGGFYYPRAVSAAVFLKPLNEVPAPAAEAASETPPQA